MTENNINAENADIIVNIEDKKGKETKKARNSVTAMTKMFERKNSQKERRSSQNKIPINVLEDNNAKSERGTDSAEIEEDNNSTRKRGASILDKINMFNKNATPVTTVKKDGDSSILPLTNYVKILDEQSKKIKWVAATKTEEENSTKKTDNDEQENNIIIHPTPEEESNLEKVDEKENLAEPKGVQEIVKTIESDKINIQAGSDELNQFENTNNPIESVNNKNENHFEEIKEVNESRFSEISKNNNVNTKSDDNDRDLASEEESSDVVLSSDNNEVIEIKITDTDINKENSPDIEVNKEVFADILLHNNPGNENKLFSTQSPIKNDKIEIFIDSSTTENNNVEVLETSKRFSKEEKQIVDDFFSKLNNNMTSRTFTLDNLNKLVESKEEKIKELNLKDKNLRPVKSKIISIEKEEEDTNEKNKYKNNTVVNLVKQKSPEKRQKSWYAQKFNYDELSSNNADTVVNASNMNLSQNYNSLFNTMRSGLNDNVLFSDQKRKSMDTVNEQEVKIILEVDNEEPDKEQYSFSLTGLIIKYKYFVYAIIIILVIVIIFLLLK